MKLNIVMPMAGKGSRFLAAGYYLPKPIIPVLGRRMIDLAMENITEDLAPSVTFIYADEDARRHPEMTRLLLSSCPSARLIGLEFRPKSPAETLLAGLKELRSDAPVLVLNCDQHVTHSGGELLRLFLNTGVSVAAFVMRAEGAAYVRVDSDENGRILSVLGKSGKTEKPALTGLYFFKDVATAISLTQDAISPQSAHEVCVSETLSVAIARGMPVAGLHLGSESEICSIIGDPEKLTHFINSKN